MEKPMSDLFQRWCTDIQGAYVRLGHTMGWQFLTSPRATLSRKSRIALITMNPGGSVDRPDHGRESSESGSAYIVEAWKQGYAPGEAPLQMQVRRMFGMLAAASDAGMTGDELLNTSLAGYFVPFRSPQFNALPRRRESLAFAATLWKDIFDHIDPALIITIDRHTTRHLLPIVSALHGRPTREPLPIGWGSFTADVFPFLDNSCSLLRLPHLSRFPVFGREASQQHVARLVTSVLSSLPRLCRLTLLGQRTFDRVPSGRVD